MTDSGDSYRGDETLSRLLAEAGSPYDHAGLRDLLAGVLAAPEPVDAEAWMVMVAAAPGEALPDNLKDQLRALKAQLAASTTTGAQDRAARLSALRAELERRGLAGFLVPRADEHQGEYVPPRAERLEWLTGFTGSAGLAVVLSDKAAIFVDGRYTLQVESQGEVALFEPRHLIEQPAEKWIGEHLPEGRLLGYDPWLHTEDQVKRFKLAASKAGGEAVPCEDNPLDAVWSDQPPPPLAPIVPQETLFAGRSSAEKRAELVEVLAEKGAEAAFLSLPDSIAWLLNVRGGDVARSPLPLSFALVGGDGRVDWFVDRRKLVPGLEEHLGNAVAVRPPAELGAALDALGGTERKQVLVDPTSAPVWAFDRLRAAGATLVTGADPCQLPKAKKNATELEGTRQAHRRDGGALARFLAWLAEAAPRRAQAGSNPVTEVEAAERLAGYRGENERFRDLSFDTISGAGPNGAIVHYRADETSNRALAMGELYLVDSGGQYLDGTTDVTRTVAIGGPTAEMRRHFTLVLKGHIALATVRFPKGTTGSQLDVLARLPLWQAGFDFDHGTGHGVGSYLGVHEGPQRIAKLPNRVPLEPGMIVSNEPGYYRPGGYGIRIENLVTVVESPGGEGEEREMRAFETLTLAPIDLALVEPALMTALEIAWLDAYHARVRAAIGPLVEGETAVWLERATRPLDEVVKAG